MRAHAALLLGVLSLATVAVAAAAKPKTSEAEYGLAYMARFDRLPVLKETVCKQVSSYDRSGGNADFGHFLNGDAGKLPNDTALLADLKGPGCVYRLWSANAAGNIRMYFDGETTPRIACPMQDLFTNKYAPFHTPIAGHVSGGWYSYLPLPYEKSLRIEVEHPGQMYYHVQYQELPAGTPVRSFTRELTGDDQANLDRVLKQWTSPELLMGPEPGKIRHNDGSGELQPGDRTRILDVSGDGVVRALKVRTTPNDRFALRGLVLRAYWDGKSQPAVDAPLGDFFGSLFGDKTYHSLPLSMGSDGYACYFPMPFKHGARIEIVNEGSKPVRLTWELHTGDYPHTGEELARFHAKWHKVRTEEGKHVTLLETSGRGHYVGVSLGMQGDRGIGYLEGDEKIYVDGEKEPSIYGTGTEDYFTGGWYFDQGPFNLLYHGLITKDEPASRINAYRMQITDAVPFRKNIRVDIEHGGMNDFPGVDYFFTTYWYQDSATDNWGPLVPVADRRPPSIILQNVQDAERLPSVLAREIDDSGLPVELSRGGALTAATPGQPFSVQFNLSQAAYVSLTLGLLRGPGGGTATISLDDKPLPDEIDLSAPAVSVDRVRVQSVRQLAAGDHRLTLRAPAGSGVNGMGAVLDYLVLRRMLSPYALEAEKLRVVQQTPGAPLGPQEMASFGPRWSDDRQLWFRPAEAGASFTLEVPVERAGRYRLVGYFTKAIDYGQVQLSVDGTDVGKPFEGFNDGVIHSGPVEIGTVELTGGTHRLKFTVTGKNPRSTGYLVGVDAVELTPLP